MEAAAAKTLSQFGPPAPAARVSRLNLQELDPSLSVNTGAGLPGWSWNRVELSWSGPVKAGQQMRFWLIPPAANFLGNSPVCRVRAGIQRYGVMNAEAIFTAAGHICPCC